MGAANVAILEQRKPVEHRRGGDAVETGKHTPIAQDADIVERRFYCCEHLANCNLGSVHQGHLKMSFLLEGVQGRERDCFKTQFTMDSDRHNAAERIRYLVMVL
jgi:hypothetical protein